VSPCGGATILKFPPSTPLFFLAAPAVGAGHCMLGLTSLLSDPGPTRNVIGC
jgi:hypothetical protein